MTDKKLPNVLLCVSVFQILAESNWRREAYKKPPEIRYLLNHFPLMLWWIVTTSAHFKRFSHLNILFCLFTIYVILHPSLYILAAFKKSMHAVINIVLNINFDKCKRLFLNTEYDQRRNQVSLKLLNFVSSSRMLWYFI